MGRRDTRISAVAAIWDALKGKSLDYFPRDFEGSTFHSKSSNEVISEIVASLESVNAMADDEKDRIVRLTRESLDEVKALTEHQDGKATRLLTILTFLSALAAVMFGKVLEAFPVNEFVARWRWEWSTDWWIAVAYGSFVAFALLAISGALITFHAIRTRFKYSVPEVKKSPRSFIFYEGMIAASPAGWAEAFRGSSPNELRDPSIDYVKNYILEAYLVAAKTADKLRYLSAAQTLQAFSIKLLMLFVVTSAVGFVVTAPIERDDETAQRLGRLEAAVNALASQPIEQRVDGETRNTETPTSGDD